MCFSGAGPRAGSGQVAKEPRRASHRLHRSAASRASGPGVIGKVPAARSPGASLLLCSHWAGLRGAGRGLAGGTTWWGPILGALPS